MTWIDFRLKKPETDITAWIANEKGWMYDMKATYHKNEDAWIANIPLFRHSLVLEVTHYIEIPDYPVKA